MNRPCVDTKNYGVFKLSINFSNEILSPNFMHFYIKVFNNNYYYYFAVHIGSHHKIITKFIQGVSPR